MTLRAPLAALPAALSLGIAVLGFVVLAAGALRADPAAQAEAAARDLFVAIERLQQAEARADRVGALSQTILAYEDGLAALRDNLRPISLREAEITARLQSRDAELSQVLGVLLATGQQDQASLLVHPEGALAAARAAMLLGDVTPALARSVASLSQDLDELRSLRQARSFALAALEAGLSTAQEARAALARAIDDRGPLPRRFSEDPATLAAIARDAETLDAFARSLTASGADQTSQAAAMVPVLAARGTLPLPVRGTVLRRFNAADAAGIRRPGLVIATAPQALVTAPWSATVRYAGPLAGQGQVVILEPDEDILMILAGLGPLYVSTGEILPQGAPLAVMPARADEGSEGSMGTAATGGLDETLYFELRQSGDPIDPEPWFALTGG